jgi:hypothetical protein
VPGAVQKEVFWAAPDLGFYPYQTPNSIICFSLIHFMLFETGFFTFGGREECERAKEAGFKTV